MTTIFFLRHGLTQENSERRMQGHTPGTLLIRETERYLSAVVTLLRDQKINALISSDLLRAVQTREILKSFLQQPTLPEVATPLLRERSFGLYEGILWAELPPAIQEETLAAEYNFRPYGGENFQDMRQRIREALTFFSQRYQKQTIICVTHGGWLRELARLHGEALLDQWSNRSAIYQAGVEPQGRIMYLKPLLLPVYRPDVPLEVPV